MVLIENNSESASSFLQPKPASTRQRQPKAPSSQPFPAVSAPSIQRSHTVGVALLPQAEPVSVPSALPHFVRSSTDAPPQLLDPNSEQTADASNRASYAHRRSVSGWDRLFSDLSQRAENNADEHHHNHQHSPNQDSPQGDKANGSGLLDDRVPGIGEDSLAHDDVQYVYE
ncbi:hypothetical protein GGI07_004069 [Coemansia sp. Benny D115]|nr:hypothetical protein GGI07_004069 [Coemansia sp. Benny D115]